jgi:hypothetical protein
MPQQAAALGCAPRDRASPEARTAPDRRQPAVDRRRGIPGVAAVPVSGDVFDGDSLVVVGQQGRRYPTHDAPRGVDRGNTLGAVISNSGDTTPAWSRTHRSARSSVPSDRAPVSQPADRPHNRTTVLGKHLASSAASRNDPVSSNPSKIFHDLLDDLTYPLLGGGRAAATPARSSPGFTGDQATSVRQGRLGIGTSGSH